MQDRLASQLETLELTGTSHAAVISMMQSGLAARLRAHSAQSCFTSVQLKVQAMHMNITWA